MVRLQQVLSTAVGSRETHAIPTVFVINDDDSVREALASLIRATGWRPETFADARSFLRQPRVLVPSAVVLDAELPDLCGLDLQALFMNRPDMPVIFTAKRPVLRAAVLAMKAGAVEFLPELLDEGLLLSAIRASFLRSHAALVREAEMSVLYGRYATLSNREREVMAHVIAGKPNKVIAEDLAISEITVKAHRGRAMRKMQAASLPHLVNMAARLGLTTFSDRGVPPTQALLRKTCAPRLEATQT